MTIDIAVVTGGAGFIGSHMVDLLIDLGMKVRIIDNLSGGNEANIKHHSSNSNVEFYCKDIRNLEPGDPIFNKARYVFHFAGIGEIVPSIERPIDYMDVNVQGTVRVLECARSAVVEKFVYASSSSCYGLANTPTNEKHPIQPQYPYALSKFLGEQTAFHWNKVYKLPVNAVCIFNAYGPRVRTSGAYGAVFGVFLKQKLAGKPFTVVGDGRQTRDFIYATDVARAFLAAAKTSISGERFNIGSGKPQSINRLVELIGGDVVYVPKRPGEPDNTFANIDKITSELNWKPVVKFEDGVKIMIDNINCWSEAPLWDPTTIADATKSWFKYMKQN